MWKTLPRMDVIHPCVGRGVRKAEPSHVFSLPLPSSINQFPFLPRSSEVEKLSYEIYNSKIKCIFLHVYVTQKKTTLENSSPKGVTHVLYVTVRQRNGISELIYQLGTFLCVCVFVDSQTVSQNLDPRVCWTVSFVICFLFLLYGKYKWNGNMNVTHVGQSADRRGGKPV